MICFIRLEKISNPTEKLFIKHSTRLFVFNECDGDAIVSSRWYLCLLRTFVISKKYSKVTFSDVSLRSINF